MSNSSKKQMTIPDKIVEPVGNLSFSSPKELRQHVIKHCLENTGQRWQEIFTKDKLYAASYVYYQNDLQHPALLELMEMYRSLLSDITVKYCEAGKRHLHFVEERQVTEQSQICQFVVEVWDYERKIKIIAKAFVRKHKISPYVLCSGYRKRNFTDNALHQEIVKRLNAKIFIKKDPNNPYGTKMTLIADHSGLTE